MKLVNGQWNRLFLDMPSDEIGDQLMEIRAEVGSGIGLLLGLGQVHQRSRLFTASSLPSGERTIPIIRRASVIPPLSPA